MLVAHQTLTAVAHISHINKKQWQGEGAETACFVSESATACLGAGLVVGGIASCFLVDGCEIGRPEVGRSNEEKQEDKSQRTANLFKKLRLLKDIRDN